MRITYIVRWEKGNSAHNRGNFYYLSLRNLNV